MNPSHWFFCYSLELFLINNLSNLLNHGILKTDDFQKVCISSKIGQNVQGREISPYVCRQGKIIFDPGSEHLKFCFPKFSKKICLIDKTVEERSCLFYRLKF